MSIINLPEGRSFEEAVRRLQELDTAEADAVFEAAFEMGDIALEQCPVLEHGSNLDAGVMVDMGVGTKLQELADAADIPRPTLETRRHVSNRIPVLYRYKTAPWTVYSLIARVENEPERIELLKLVGRSNPDREDGRWTKRAIGARLPRRPGVSDAPEFMNDPAEQALDQACRGIDYLLMHNDVERLERFRVYWHRQVPEKLQALDWWNQKQEERQQQAERRAERKQAAS